MFVAFFWQRAAQEMGVGKCHVSSTHVIALNCVVFVHRNVADMALTMPSFWGHSIPYNVCVCVCVCLCVYVHCVTYAA